MSHPAVFLSHTGQDLSARHLTAFLNRTLEKQCQISCFYDVRNVPPQSYWNAKIEDAVIHCRVFVAVLSPKYFYRYWCLHELDLAMREGKKIVPVFADVGFQLPTVDGFRAQAQEMFSERVDDEILERWCRNISHLDKIQAVRNKWDTKDSLVHVEEETVETIQALVGHVYISYTGPGSVALNLSRALLWNDISTAYPVFRTETGPPPSFEENVQYDASHCQLFVCIVRFPNYFLQPWSMKELDVAIQSKRRILLTYDGPPFDLDEALKAVNDAFTEQLDAEVLNRWRENVSILSSVETPRIPRSEFIKGSEALFQDVMLKRIESLLAQGT